MTGKNMILQGPADKMMEKAAWLIYKEGIEKLLQQQSTVVIAVPGGRSVTAIFKELKRFPVDWGRVHIFMLDERLVPIDHKDSNYRLLHEALGGHVGDGFLHPFTFLPEDPEKGCREYEDELNGLGGRFDIVLASSGEDGHIASLFTEQVAIEDEGGGFLLVKDSPKPPRERMTAGRKLLADAQAGFLLFIGRGKQEALRNFLDPEVQIAACPAKLIATIQRHFVFTDQEIER